jgi:hypothetical protein
MAAFYAGLMKAAGQSRGRLMNVSAMAARRCHKSVIIP